MDPTLRTVHAREIVQRQKLSRVALVSVLAGVAFYVTLIVNADYLRKYVQPTFDFGEREMLQILGSINRTKTWSFEHSQTRFELDVSLRQQPGADVVRNIAAADGVFQARAYACGGRTFRQTAHACLDTTDVPVDGTVTVRRTTTIEPTIVATASVGGVLSATGRHLGVVSLWLHTDRDRGDESSSREFISLQSRDARAFVVDLVRLKGTDGKPAIDFYAHRVSR